MLEAGKALHRKSRAEASSPGKARQREHQHKNDMQGAAAPIEEMQEKEHHDRSRKCLESAVVEGTVEHLHSNDKHHKQFGSGNDHQNHHTS